MVQLQQLRLLVNYFNLLQNIQNYIDLMVELTPYFFYQLIEFPRGIHDVLFADLTERTILKAGI